MGSLALARLVNRKLLKISGPDCYPYLQGLICNDLRYLYEEDRIPEREHASVSRNVMSAFMLNSHGRAICDMLLYRTPLTRHECQFTPPGKATEPDELLIECESKLASGLANTIYGYRVRRKISMSIVDDISVWCLFPQQKGAETKLASGENIYDTQVTVGAQILSDELTVVSDPRLSALGLRILSRTNDLVAIRKSLNSFVNHKIEEVGLQEYKLHRYSLGVGEGSKDHPESDCLPLECNAEDLGSVSFEKGCYLGQELTSRIHFQGVVRKRLMPITLEGIVSKNSMPGDLPLLTGTDIIDGSTKKKVGILRHVFKDKGLALLRHDLALASKQLIHEGSQTKLSTFKPYWWSQR